jgi:hypothetical protein
MPICEYKRGRANRCRKRTTVSATLNGRMVFFCPKHEAAVAEQEGGRKFKAAPKPKG